MLHEYGNRPTHSPSVFVPSLHSVRLTKSRQDNHMPTFNYGSGRLISHAEVTAIFASVPAVSLDWSDPYSAGALLNDVCRITNLLDDLVDSEFMDMVGAEYSTAAISI